MKENKLYPKRSEIYYPFIVALRNKGGTATPKDMYGTLADYFVLSDELRNRPINQGTDRQLKWDNIIRWVRQDLIGKNILKNNSPNGTWELNEDTLENFKQVEEERVAENDIVNSTYSQKQLEDLLKNQKRIGQIGEEIVLNLEKESLIKNNRIDLANNVQHISIENCKAGYDIHSFFLDGRSKYIEVKTSTSLEIQFYITINEITQAKILGENYCLYFVKALNQKTKEFQEIIQFNNLGNILDNEKFNFSPIKWRISMGDK